ncbi:MAG: hypothetical protein AAB400_04430 [Patescibacteria group bacterium]
MNVKLRQLLPTLVLLGILLAAGAGAFVAYRIYGGDIAYYLYEQNHKNLPGFDSRKQYLKSAYRAVHANPKDAQNYVDLGSSQYGIQDYTNAESNYLKALERAPNASVVFWNLTHLYIQTKEYGKAETYAKLAIERVPDKPLGYEALGELYTYYLLDKQGELPALYKTAFEKTRSTLFLLLLGGYYRDNGMADRAVETYQQWLALSPQEQNRQAVEAEIKNLQQKLPK